MITDKTIQVTTNEGQFTITITAEQIRQTVQRRMAQLMPKARITDMTEVMHDNSNQTDLTVKNRK